MKALVLSGGGSKGSYQIGVWKALRKLHIKYDIITGTSVGALNGALMTQKSYFKAKQVWKKINLKVLFGEDAIESDKSFDIYKMYAKNFVDNGGMDVSDLEKIIDKALNKRKFKKSKINYGLVTYNYTENKPEELEKKDIKEEQITDYLMASASCYPAFKMKEIDGKKYIDGGFHDNLPINLAIEMGATEIIAVDLRAPGMKKITKKKIPTTMIKPNNKLTNFLNFYEEGNDKNMKFGYNDTMKAFNKLEGNKYTFKPNTINKLIKEHQELYKHILKKILNNKILQKSIKDIINITPKDNNDIEEFAFLKIIESAAKSLDIDETKIYNYKSFTKAISKTVKKKLKENNSEDYQLDLLKKLYAKNYREIRKEIIKHPLEFVRVLYIYTVCEV